MRIVLSLPDRIGHQAERLARELGTPVSELCARAVEERVKTLTQQRAIEAIDSILGSPVQRPGGEGRSDGVAVRAPSAADDARVR